MQLRERDSTFICSLLPTGASELWDVSGDGCWWLDSAVRLTEKKKKKKRWPVNEEDSLELHTGRDEEERIINKETEQEKVRKKSVK